MKSRRTNYTIPASDSSDTDPLHVYEDGTRKIDPEKELELMSNSESEDHDQPGRSMSGQGDHSETESAYDQYKPDKLAVVVPVPKRPWEYEKWDEADTVESLLEETEDTDGELWYTVRFENGDEEEVPLSKITELHNGQNALDAFRFRTKERNRPKTIFDLSRYDRSSANSRMSSSAGKRTRGAKPKNYFEGGPAFLSDSDDDILTAGSSRKRRRVGKHTAPRTRRSGALRTNHYNNRESLNGMHFSDSDDSESDVLMQNMANLSTSNGHGRLTRSSTVSTGNRFGQKRFNISDSEGEDDQTDELAENDQLESDDEIAYSRAHIRRKKTSNGTMRLRNRKSLDRTRRMSSNSSPEPSARPTRRSSRAHRNHKSMREIGVDEEIFAEDTPEGSGPKALSVREVFQPVPKGSIFHRFHRYICDVCNGVGTNSNKGISQLIPCQGCSTSIHKICLGPRTTREHIVTKVGPGNFVLQCRRCVGTALKKDALAPRLDICQICKQSGKACSAFSTKKTSKQEEKLREQNNGEDPITEVPEDLLSNAANVLFRCDFCRRAYHFEHLPARSQDSPTTTEIEELRKERLAEYNDSWKCNDCSNMPSKIQGLVAWRPSNPNSYVPGTTIDMVNEDDREYLVKWTGQSYFKCTWMPGAWVWGITVAVMRKAFVRRDDGINLLPRMKKEDAIPEEYLQMEIIFDVKYKKSRRHTSAADESLIDEVSTVFVKFRGLSYDEAVWETPPSRDEEVLWGYFESAYDEYIAGRTFQQRSQSSMKLDTQAFRSLDFEADVELKAQPSAITGGKMMKYQMDGLNWLLYNFHQKKNVILADEMGLGKTIQVIAMLASLIKDAPKCWPFLVVTPNSTCPNWRREIQHWAPTVRVVAYYGSKRARDMAMEYELFPDGCTDMRAHVVVTSYEAPVDSYNRHFFRRINWAGLIVDEGQRLKSDTNLLYGALETLKVPFRILLTGTPLQNNKRELFNLLQFLDTSIDAARLDEKYAELTKDNLPELHDLIRPFFLRRTKLQVLKFLPPMAQVIVPVTMSILQKKLYKSILAKNPKLIKSIFGQGNTTLRASDRGNLNNILMQLRKCLCHPFIYSSAIEETSVSPEALHRNLIDASAKFQLLEIMLPKLRERGHRVLIFSQFLEQLDLVEDFLNGLGLLFQRLDGTISALEKQKRIDAFNAPGSPLFAFLLSTRAGGVGINLATADTVIIMDPDFNPHQDMQALSRAHRIGQKNKVLVFQLMTKDSAEEKIVQIGRKKMALDEALIESMDADEDAGVDLESILRHGAEALFNNDDRNDIHYDSSSVDKLLDRSQIEQNTDDAAKTAESKFSYARVWSNEKSTLVEDIGSADSDSPAGNAGLWEKILKQREVDAAREAAKHMQTFGRGRRTRQVINYNKDILPEDGPGSFPPTHRRRDRKGPADPDFAAAPESEDDSEVEPEDLSDMKDLDIEQSEMTQPRSWTTPISTKVTDPPRTRDTHPSLQIRSPAAGPFFRTSFPSDNVLSTRARDMQAGLVQKHQLKTKSSATHIESGKPRFTSDKSNEIGSPIFLSSEPKQERSRTQYQPNLRNNNRKIRTEKSPDKPKLEPQLPTTTPESCILCQQYHPRNRCPLQFSKIGRCPRCGYKHLGLTRDCNKGGSETRIRLMLDDLSRAKAPSDKIDRARLYLRIELTRIVRRKIMERRSREDG
ncbi:PHD/FYVE-zinc-finger like domain-containing protein [Xylogone sp. PMI_703]|nr:PHD/FYVE-zinc-finger like domain-containing protein [Xylogone sp. PMI_703]